MKTNPRTQAFFIGFRKGIVQGAIAGLILGFILLLFGCTTRTVEYGGVKYHSVRFAMQESFGGLTVKLTNGVIVTLEGYKSDGSQAVSAATEGAVTAILKAK